MTHNLYLPSLIDDALAAVTVPFFLNADFNCGILLKLTLSNSSSQSTKVLFPLIFTSIGSISLANKPFLVA